MSERLAVSFGARLRWLLLLAVVPGCLGEFSTRTQLLARLDGQGQDLQLQDMADDSGDTAVPADVAVQADSDVADAIAGADAIDAAVADSAPTCPGAVGCPCSSHADCTKAACLGTADGFRCAGPCGAGDTCPTSSEICTVAAGVVAKVCASRLTALCDPCKSSTSCKTTGAGDGLCVDRGHDGGFCGIACKLAADCPTDYECKEIKAIEGAIANQCVRKAAAGACPCSSVAALKQATTACAIDGNDAGGKLVGTCHGERHCEIDGLTACDAPVPASETCDGKDNDCDTLLDEDACDDGNPCTQDACLPAGCKHTGAEGQACDDGAPCTQGDVCFGVTCVGKPTECKDSACFTGSCNPASGACDNKAKPDGTGCSDGDACKTDATCNGGNCKGKSVDCNDGDPCTDDACDSDTGCLHVANTAPCNDKIDCTKDDQCKNKVCAGTANNAACDDAKPCTTDACGASGCTHSNSTAACDDKNACTTGDKCQGGACVSGTNSCACQTDAGCAQDSDICNGTLYCDISTPGSFACKVKPGSVPSCPAPTEACKVSACNPTSGCVITSAANGAACDDTSLCTVSDTCSSGKCTGGKQVDCNDANACTNDACDPTGGCSHTANTGVCNDGSLCTSGDACAGGKCIAGSEVTVCAGSADGCATASCDAATGACTATKLTGPACDDKDFCTVGDTCQGGACKSGTKKLCDDINVCTSDSCDAQDGACKYTLISCDDNNACTDNTCVPAKGCVNTTKDCSFTDKCVIGTCSPTLGCYGTQMTCGAGKYCWEGKCGAPWGASVGAGGAHSCARLVSNAAVACWGDNGNGQLGIGTVGGTQTSPVKAATDGAPESLDLGLAQSCSFVDATGSAKCWGANALGQCGNGSNADTPSVSTVLQGGIVSFASWKSASSGGNHGCGVLSDNTVGCWGDNSALQLGNTGSIFGGSGSSSNKALAVASVTNALGVATGGSHSCAWTTLASGGKLWCWGQNSSGQCGLAASTPVAPTLVSTADYTITAVAAGSQHSCALVKAVNSNVVSVACWGANDKGQAAPASAVGVAPFTLITLGAGTPTQVSVGDRHSCVRTSNGAAWCWGANDKGQLGNGFTSATATPSPVLLPKGSYQYNWKSLAVGWNHACMVRDDGTAWCWGANEKGQLGQGGTKFEPSAVPVVVPASVPM